MSANVTSRFDSHAMLQGLKAWVSCESPTYQAANVNQMMDIVQREAESAGLATSRIAGRDGLGDMIRVDAGPRNGAKAVAVLSHLDTVHPLGTLANELPIRQDGDCLYGPGVYDMKGGPIWPSRPFSPLPNPKA